MNTEISNVPISALIPMRNASSFIPNIAKQISENMSDIDEIIVINDDRNSSQDELLRRWKSEDSRVQIINGPQSGLVNALNLGIGNCSYGWIARFDADDTYLPGRVREQRFLIEPNTVAIFSDYKLVSSAGQNLGIIPSAVFPSAMSVSLVSSQRTPHPCVLMNKEAVVAAGSYRIQDQHVEDISLWLRLNKLGDLRSVPKTLFNYRIHGESISGLHRSEMKSNTELVIRDIGINLNQAYSILDSLSIKEQFYEDLTMSSRRQLLLIRELNLLAKYFEFGSEYSSMLKRVNLEALLKITNLRDLGIMGLEKLSRSISRWIN